MWRCEIEQKRERESEKRKRETPFVSGGEVESCKKLCERIRIDIRHTVIYLATVLHNNLREFHSIVSIKIK